LKIYNHSLFEGTLIFVLMIQEYIFLPFIISSVYSPHPWYGHWKKQHNNLHSDFQFSGTQPVVFAVIHSGVVV